MGAAVHRDEPGPPLHKQAAAQAAIRGPICCEAHNLQVVLGLEIQDNIPDNVEELCTSLPPCSYIFVAETEHLQAKFDFIYLYAM